MSTFAAVCASFYALNDRLFVAEEANLRLRDAVPPNKSQRGSSKVPSSKNPLTLRALRRHVTSSALKLISCNL